MTSQWHDNVGYLWDVVLENISIAMDQVYEPLPEQ